MSFKIFIVDDDPAADPNPGNGLSLINPYKLANAEFRRKSTDRYNFSIALNYTISKNLSFKSTFGYDKIKLIDRQFSDSASSYSIVFGSKKPIVNLDTTNTETFTNSNVLTYSAATMRTSTRRLLGSFPAGLVPGSGFAFANPATSATRPLSRPLATSASRTDSALFWLRGWLTASVPVPSE